MAMIQLGLYNGGTSQTSLVSYSDSDYALDNEDSKSTSGILIKYIDYTVYYESKKQTSTTTLTAESEINFVTLGLVKALRMWVIVEELRGQSVPGQSDSRQHNQILVNDNQAYMANLNCSQYNSRNRHLATRFHWNRKEIQCRSFSIRYEPTN